jgi:hypothetical protein
MICTYPNKILISCHTKYKQSQFDPLGGVTFGHVQHNGINCDNKDNCSSDTANFATAIAQANIWANGRSGPPCRI